MIVVDVVVAAELVIQESVLKCVNQKRFHIQEMRVKKLKKKEKEIWEEEIYNSLHWEISWSELLSELYKKENHMSASDRNFICKPYSYKVSKHVLTDNDNCTTTFSDT